MYQGGRAAKGSAGNCSHRKSKQSSCRGWRRASTAKAGKGFQGLWGNGKLLSFLDWSCAVVQKDKRARSALTRGKSSTFPKDCLLGQGMNLKHVSESKSRSHHWSSMSMGLSKSISLSQLAQDSEVKACVLLLASSDMSPPARTSTRETLWARGWARRLQDGEGEDISLFGREEDLFSGLI